MTITIFLIILLWINIGTLILLYLFILEYKEDKKPRSIRSRFNATFKPKPRIRVKKGSFIFDVPEPYDDVKLYKVKPKKKKCEHTRVYDFYCFECKKYI